MTEMRPSWDALSSVRLAAEGLTENESEAVWRARSGLIEQAFDSPLRAITFEEIDEGETLIRRSASYTLATEGYLEPDFKYGLRLTEQGRRWALGIKAGIGRDDQYLDDM